MDDLPPLAPGPLPPGQVHLRILATTDLHMHLHSYDYYAAAPTLALGLARAGGLIGRLRAEAPNSLLFDSGDFLQGSPMADYLAHVRGLGAGEIHPVIAAMNALGYDAATLGNHEFDYGLDFLMRALAGARFPLTSANAVRVLGAVPGEDLTLLAPWLVLPREVADGQGRRLPLRVGVIGLLPPQSGLWGGERLAGRVAFRDMVGAAAARLPQLRAAGADLVVVLAHTGIGSSGPGADSEDAALALAALPGVDVVLAGHSHLVFPSAHFAPRPGVDPAAGRLHDRPAVMAGCFGSHVGVIDLALEPGPGGWRLAAARAEARPIAARGRDGRLRALAPAAAAPLAASRPLHAATRRYMARPVGATPVPLSTHFALVGDCAAMRRVGAAARDHAAALLSGTADAALPVLAAVAPYKAGGRGGPENYTRIPAGPLARRHVADLYAFSNDVRVLRITGEGLRDWLDRSAAIYRRLVAGRQDQPLIDPSFPSYGFDSILGLTYRLDPSVPPRFGPDGVRLGDGPSRVRDLAFAGRPVAAGDVFALATNSYRVATLEAAGVLSPGDRIATASEPWREVIARWIAGHRGPVPLPPPGWSLVLPPDASVVFATGPGADPGELAGLAAEPLGRLPSGMVRYRLRAGGG